MIDRFVQGDLVTIAPGFGRPELVGLNGAILAGSEIPNDEGADLYCYLLWTKAAGPVAAFADEVIAQTSTL